MDEQKITADIIATLHAMNRCWTAGWNEEEFRKYIHLDAVAIVPTAPGRLEGREAYVAGWREFARSSIVHEWKETDHKVQVYAGGKCAVVTNFFTITFAMGPIKQTMHGRDMYFLVKEGRQWLVAADQFSPEPLQAPAGS